MLVTNEQARYASSFGRLRNFARCFCSWNSPQVSVGAPLPTFADSARDGAEAIDKSPIALLDGGKLVDLLLQTGLGARQSSVTLYRLNLDDLNRDTLEAVVEQQGEDDDGS